MLVKISLAVGLVIVVPYYIWWVRLDLNQQCFWRGILFTSDLIIFKFNIYKNLQLGKRKTLSG